MKENNLKNLNEMIRDPEQKMRLKKSRSDKILTTMRKLRNQEKFLHSDENENYINFPFNQKSCDTRNSNYFAILGI